MQLRWQLRRRFALHCTACLSHRGSDPAGAEGTSDLGWHRAAIVALCVLSSHDWGTRGCPDVVVASSPVLYVKARTAPPQAISLRRAMGLLIGGHSAYREADWHQAQKSSSSSW